MHISICIAGVERPNSDLCSANLTGLSRSELLLLQTSSDQHNTGTEERMHTSSHWHSDSCKWRLVYTMSTMHH